MVTPRSSLTAGTSGRSGIDRAPVDDLVLARLDPHAAAAFASSLDRIRRARPRWMALAACVGSGIDFTNPSTKARAAALQVCGTCPVMLDCRSWAMSIDDGDAVLGGLDPAARRLARKRAGATP